MTTPELDVWDAAVRITEGIDPWCSQSTWAESARQSWAPTGEALHLVGDHAQLLAQHLVTPDGTRILAGLERLWGFASPIAGASTAEAAIELTTMVGADKNWDALVFAGLSLERGLGREFIARAASGHSIRVGPAMTRRIADLDPDLSDWWKRRSSRFRRGMSQAQNRADAAGLTVDILDDAGPTAVMERVRAVEQHSWKGQQGSGILPDDLSHFYSLLLARCAEHSGMRAAVARLDGEDVGYVIGAVLGNRYRGFQIAYSESARELSVGNLLQLHEIRRLAASGVEVYDAGMDMEYKRRWTDRELTTNTMMVGRR